MRGVVFVVVAHERSGGLPVSDDIAEAAARLHDLGRQAIHVDIALVADHKPLRRIEQQQALRHVVDGGIQPLLFQLQPLLRRQVLQRQLAHHREQQGGDHEDEKSGHDDQKDDLLLPVGQRRRYRCRRHDHDGKVRQGAGRNQPVAAVHRTGQPGGAVLLVEQRLLMRRTGLEVAADHLLDMRMARQQRAVAMVHRNRRILSKRYRLEEFREAGGLDASSDRPQEFAVRSGQLARQHGGPGAGDTAVDRFNQQRGGFGVRLEGLEKRPVGDVDGPRRPAGGGIDHHAVRIEQVDAADIGKCVDLGLEHLVNVRAGHPALVVLAGFDAGGLHIGGDVLLDGAEVLQLLVEMAGQQQHGVFEFAGAAVQRAFAKIAGHDGGADRDGGDQESTADDEPADRVAADRAREVQQGGRLFRHRS